MGDNSHLVGMLQAEKTLDFFLEDTDKVICSQVKSLGFLHKPFMDLS